MQAGPDLIPTGQGSEHDRTGTVREGTRNYMNFEYFFNSKNYKLKLLFKNNGIDDNKNGWISIARDVGNDMMHII